MPNQLTHWLLPLCLSLYISLLLASSSTGFLDSTKEKIQSKNKKIESPSTGQRSPCMKMERKSSIETEPKTLNFDQMHFAREAALHVFNNKSIEEALNIFTEGLEPVVDILKDDVIMSDSEDVESYVGDCFTSEADTFQYHHELPTILSTTTDFGRDVVSAPF